MKKSSNSTTPAASNATEWIRWLWEVEAEHSPMIGSRLKFGLPLVAPGRNRKRPTSRKRSVVKA
ncbi:MAG: hypothetical protein ACO1TE_16205 [Prosthecobacter sp.]